MNSKYGISLKTQVLYALLCVVWNLVVIIQNQIGVQPIGPTGSVTVILSALLIVVLLIVALRKAWEWCYLLVSGVICALAMSAVHAGITNDPALWPSQFWQIAGVMVNVIGVLSFAVVLANYFGAKKTNTVV